MDKEKIIQKIKNFSMLEDNWDGYGAKSFTPTLISYFLDIVNLLPNIDCSDIGEIFVVPGPGGMQLEFTNKINKKELEIEINMDIIGFLKVIPKIDHDDEYDYIEGEFSTEIGYEKIKNEMENLIQWIIS